MKDPLTEAMVLIKRAKYLEGWADALKYVEAYCVSARTVVEEEVQKVTSECNALADAIKTSGSKNVS